MSFYYPQQLKKIKPEIYGLKQPHYGWWKTLCIFLKDVQFEFHKTPVEAYRSKSICESPARNMRRTVLCSR